MTTLFLIIALVAVCVLLAIVIEGVTGKDPYGFFRSARKR